MSQEKRDLLVARTMYDLMSLSTEYRQKVFGVIHPVEIFETYTLAHIRRKIGKQAKPHISVSDVIEMIDEVYEDAAEQGYDEYRPVMETLKYRVKEIAI